VQLVYCEWMKIGLELELPEVGWEWKEADRRGLIMLGDEMRMG
jgi:hypothetical protein